MASNERRPGCNRGQQVYTDQHKLIVIFSGTNSGEFKMKKTALMIVLLLIPSLLFSQESQRFNPDKLRNKNAILFSIDGFKLGSVNGGLGWKKWTAGNLILFTTFKINYSKEIKEKTNALSGIENHHTSFGATFGLLKHLNLKNKLLPYFGGQLGGGYEQTEHKTIPNDELFSYFYRATYSNETKRKLTTISLHLIFGVEYFVKNNISIEGQYRFGGNYGFGNDKTISNLVDGDQDVTKTELGIWSSSIILSIYL